MSLNSPVARRVRNALFIGIFLFVTCSPHGGFCAYVLLPFFACSWLVDLFVMLRTPEQRARRAERILTWVLAFCLAGAVNLYWFRESRAYANNVVSAVVNYKARTGTYPTDLQEAGIRPERAFDKWMLVYGVSSDGRPGLSYAVPYIAFDMYDFDFDTGQWLYLPN
jgi:hypothetical protein